MLRRVGVFLLELFVFFPLSAILTLCAWFPIFMIWSTLTSGEPMNVIIFAPLTIGVGWGIGFGISKFRMWIKGRQTDEFYEVDYHEVSYDVEESFWIQDYYKITENHTYGTRTESENTGWGMLAILQSFIALPCSLITVLMSFLSFFMPAIHVTPWRVEEDEVGSLNLFLHALFDFVIIPVHLRRTGRPHALGLLILPVGIIAPVVALFGGAIIGEFTTPLFAPLIPEWIGIILGLVLVFFILSFIIISIEKCVLAVMDFSKYRVRRTLILLGILTVVMLIGIVIFFAAVS